MKSKEFRSFLEALAVTVPFGGNSSELLVVAPLLDLAPDLTVENFTKRLADLSTQNSASSENSLIGVAMLFENLKVFSTDYMKPAVAKDIAHLANFFGKHREASLHELVATSREFLTSKRRAVSSTVTKDINYEAVQPHWRRLDESLGDEQGFNTAFAALKADPAMGKAEMIALAKQFASTIVGSKKEAEKKILGRHQALMNSRNRSGSSAGRLAGG
jgi:hypothetical protein